MNIARQCVCLMTRRVCVDDKIVMGSHTADVERTNLTSRQMNGRLVRKTWSYSKQIAALAVACTWEDWVYNLTRPLNLKRSGRVRPYASLRSA
jgi:hypothetical protein